MLYEQLIQTGSVLQLLAFSTVPGFTLYKEPLKRFSIHQCSQQFEPPNKYFVSTGKGECLIQTKLGEWSYKGEKKPIKSEIVKISRQVLLLTYSKCYAGVKRSTTKEPFAGHIKKTLVTDPASCYEASIVRQRVGG